MFITFVSELNKQSGDRSAELLKNTILERHIEVDRSIILTFGLIR